MNKTKCLLIVPIGSKAAYMAADYWKDFINIKEGILVMFNTQGGSSVADTVVNYNTNIIAPVDPINTDHTFAGWYKEAACINAWDFASNVVTTDTTLYAKWISSPNYVKTQDAIILRMFPNPADDFVKIDGDKLGTVTIYNLLGIPQLQLNLKGEENSTISISNLNHGCYLVCCKTISGKVYFWELIKK